LISQSADLNDVQFPGVDPVIDNDIEIPGVDGRTSNPDPQNVEIYDLDILEVDPAPVGA
jgi:hypothetical protein